LDQVKIDACPERICRNYYASAMGRRALALPLL
jgi:hypothetical protein